MEANFVLGMASKHKTASGDPGTFTKVTWLEVLAWLVEDTLHTH